MYCLYLPNACIFGLTHSMQMGVKLKGVIDGHSKEFNMFFGGIIALLDLPFLSKYLTAEGSFRQPNFLSGVELSHQPKLNFFQQPPYSFKKMCSISNRVVGLQAQSVKKLLNQSGAYGSIYKHKCANSKTSPGSTLICVYTMLKATNPGRAHFCCRVSLKWVEPGLVASKLQKSNPG